MQYKIYEIRLGGRSAFVYSLVNLFVTQLYEIITIKIQRIPHLEWVLVGGDQQGNVP
jgi:hypothetical protein